MPSTCSQEHLVNLIEKLNGNDAVDGILLQSPLPKHMNESELVERILPDKDVDGFHPYNLGCLALRNPLLRPCTPKGVMTLLNHTGINLKQSHTVIVGASNIVGRPMALELLLAGSTVSVCHRFTPNLEYFVKQADCLITAVGKASIVKGDWIKPGAVVIDVGITRNGHGKLCGDVDFKSAKERAAWITPVPGGVGPMTIASLLDNTLKAANELHD